MYSITKYLILATGFVVVLSSGVLALDHNIGGLMRLGCMGMMNAGWGERPNEQWKR